MTSSGELHVVPRTDNRDTIDLSQESTGVSPQLSTARFDRATKIVATLGPASNTEAGITELVEAGANVFRLNFSHGTHEQHQSTIEIVRAVSAKLGTPVAVVQDLCGPKIRISELPGGEISLEEGGKVSLRYGSGSKHGPSGTVLSTLAFRPEQVLQAGERVLLADAKLELRVTAVSDLGVETEVVRGGKLRSKAGLAVPDSELNLPPITEKDLRDLEWGVKNGVDYVALSFVREAADIIQLRAEMARLGRVVPIIAKIERKQALDNLVEIIQATDAVMVARGDLGVDIPIEKLPFKQRQIVDLAKQYGKPVIVATQMLLSMVESEVPTRSEVTDVFCAAGMGADAVMLSEETAIGKNPAECVRVMAKVANEGENYFDFDAHQERVTRKGRPRSEDADIVAMSASAASRSTWVDAIIVCSESGNTSRLVSEYRPHVPIYGVSTNAQALSRMALFWGVNPLPMQLSSSSEEERERAFQFVAKRFFEEHPEHKEFGAILVNGPRPGEPYSPSRFEIRRCKKE